MNRTRRLITAVAVAGSMIGSGAAGAAIVALTSSPGTVALAASSQTSASPGTGSRAAPSGTFVPNEDPTHEAGESAAREAQENAGQRPTVP